MDVHRSHIVGSLGVSGAKDAVQRHIGWLWRDQLEHDFGIDAHIEVIASGKATGRLIGVQVKASDDKYVEKVGTTGWTLYLDEDNVRYWLDHALPVIVVIHDVKDNQYHWQQVTSTSVERTPAGSPKIQVPVQNKLDAGAMDRLQKISAGTPRTRRENELFLALPWVKALADGKRILVELDDWINKTRGQMELTLKVLDEDDEVTFQTEWMVLVGFMSVPNLLREHFPWADLHLNEQVYDEADHDLWESEAVKYDEGDRIVLESFEDWALGNGLGELRPYGNSAGEVDHWSIELTLNDLGRGMLAIEEFVERDHFLATPESGPEREEGMGK